MAHSTSQKPSLTNQPKATTDLPVGGKSTKQNDTSQNQNKLLKKLETKLKKSNNDTIFVKYQSIINGEWLSLSLTICECLERINNGQIINVASITTTQSHQTFLAETASNINLTIIV